MKPSLRKVLGQPSWRIVMPQVEAFVTETGGHVGPVKFRLGRRVVTPYSVAPWAQERSVQRDPKTPDIIKVLRGDFFCMPFGGNASAFGREKHPVHGEVANAKWKLESLKSSRAGATIGCSMRTRVRKSRVDKLIELRKGHHAIYSRHLISGASGPMSLGHHAMLKFLDAPGSGVVSTSRFVYGQVFPKPLERPEDRGYSMLKPGAAFDSIEHVPTITGETTDLSRYPARRGFEDLVMLVSDRSLPFTWTAVVFAKERYVWFALKDPRVLASTILWISNGGRHYAPWSGRHVNVMGLEEVTSYFHPGLAESAANNPVARAGHPTALQLDAQIPTVVNYIMAVAEIPRGFDRVASIDAGGVAGGDAGVVLRAASGASVTASIDLSFLGGGA